MKSWVVFENKMGIMTLGIGEIREKTDKNTFSCSPLAA